MAYKTVGNFESLPTFFLNRNGEGTISEFKLLEAKQVQNKTYPDKLSTVYTVEYNGKDLADLQKTLDTDSAKMQFWGDAVTNNRFANIEFGSQVRVTYTGEKPASIKGHHPFKDYIVQVDDGQEGEDDPTGVEETASKKKVPF